MTQKPCMTVTYNGVRLEIPDDQGWAAYDYILRRLCGEPRDDAKFDAIMSERWAVKNEPKKGRNGDNRT